MRITIVTETYPPEVNGVALTIARAVAFLRRRGHAVDVVRPSARGEQPGAGPGEWRTPGLPLGLYPDLRIGLQRSATLARRLLATDAELVHVVTEGPLGASAVTAARRLGLPATSDFRTNFHVYAGHYRCGWAASVVEAYLRRLHNRTALTFAPTAQTRAALLDSGYEHVAVCGRGVDLQRFGPHRRDDALRARLNPQGGPILLHVGRLAREKNVRLALDAALAACRRCPDAGVVVVGDGPMRSALESAYPTVTFVGMRGGDELAAYYASADLFLFPSLSETFGNVTLEALASSLPVIAYDVAAAAEHVIDGRCGRLVAPGRESDFVAAVVELTARRERLAAMRVHARRAAEAADWDRTLASFERQLEEVVHAHGSAAIVAATQA